MDKSEVNRRFGQAVREARRTAHLSQEQLAAQSSVPRASLSLIETGEQSANMVTLLKISRALQITPEQLVSSIAEESDVATSDSKHASRASEIRRKHLADVD